MKTAVEELYYLLREGATSEEQWSWEDLGDMCSRGELSPGAQVYLADNDTWSRLDQTDLASHFESDNEDDDGDREALAGEYEDALRNLTEQPESIEFLIDAARLACDTGDRESSQRYFQRALDLRPYNGRVAQEVTRCLSSAECARMRMLTRPDSISDDITAPVNYALAGGLLYLAIPAAVFFGLSFIPGGVWLSSTLAVLWCFQMMKRVAANDPEPPRWKYALADPVGEMVLPLSALVGTALPLFAVFYGIARLVMLFDSEVATSTIDYIANSPILAVAFVVVFVAYLPSVVMWIMHSKSGALNSLNPVRTVGLIIRMGQEYALNGVLLLGVAFLVGLIHATIGGIVVVGSLVTAMAMAFALPLVAFVLGRLRARHDHAF